MYQSLCSFPLYWSPQNQTLKDKYLRSPNTMATNPTTDPPKVQIHLDQVPFYDGAVDCIKMGIESSLQADLDAEVVEPTRRGKVACEQWILWSSNMCI